MAKKAGEAYIELSLRDRVTRQLSKINRDITQMAANVAKIGVGLTAVSAAIVAAFAPAVRQAAEAEEIFSKFNAVFKENAAAAEAWATTFAGSIQRSRVDVMKFASEFQDLFVPMGATREEAMELAKTLTKLGFDLASFNNKADPDAMRDLMAAATGSSEVMKKYGSMIQEADMTTFAEQHGLAWKELDALGKAQLRVAKILEDTGDAQGDAERTAGSFTNTVKGLQGAVKDFGVEVGQKLLPILAPIGAALKLAVDFGRQIISVYPGVIYLVVALGAAFGAAGVALLALAGALAVAAVAMKAFGLISTIVTGVLSAGLWPIIGLIVVGLTAMAAALTFSIGVLMTASEAFKAFVRTMQEGLGQTAERIKETFGLLQTFLTSGKLKEAWQLLSIEAQLVWMDLMDFLREKWDDMVLYLIGAFWDALLQLAQMVTKWIPPWVRKRMGLGAGPVRPRVTREERREDLENRREQLRQQAERMRQAQQANQDTLTTEQIAANVAEQQPNATVAGRQAELPTPAQIGTFSLAMAGGLSAFQATTDIDQEQLDALEGIREAVDNQTAVMRGEGVNTNLAYS